MGSTAYVMVCTGLMPSRDDHGRNLPAEIRMVTLRIRSRPMVADSLTIFPVCIRK